MQRRKGRSSKEDLSGRNEGPNKGEAHLFSPTVQGAAIANQATPTTTQEAKAVPTPIDVKGTRGKRKKLREICNSGSATPDGHSGAAGGPQLPHRSPRPAGARKAWQVSLGSSRQTRCLMQQWGSSLPFATDCIGTPAYAAVTQYSTAAFHHRRESQGRSLP